MPGLAEKGHMLEGRKQLRTLERFLVQISAVDDSRLAELVSAENVSSRGLRVATERFWEPGSHVLLKSPTGNLWARARVVYCQAVNGKAFAVGLDFLTQTSDWETRNEPSISKPHK
jgi:PilZ domain-containing protein